MASKKEKALKAANRFLQKGQVDKAIREYEKILVFDARDPRIRHKYAELLARKGRREDALEELRWVAEYYQQGGFYPKAIAIFKQMLGLDSDNIDVHLQLGQIYHGQRKVSDATIHFQKAAAMVERSGTAQQKIEVHERLYMLAPTDLEAAWRLVAMYTGIAKPNKAMDLLIRMAERLRTEGELDKLLSVLDRLAGIADEPTAYLKEMAYVLLQRGKPDSAISKLQLCFKKDPQDTETLEMLARAFQEQGESEKAIQVYEELRRILILAGDERATEIDGEIHGLRPQEVVVVSQDEPSEEFSESSPLELPEGISDEALYHIVRGDTFLRYGLVEKAKTEGNEAVHNWPDLFASHQLRARSLVRLVRPDDAADSYMQMYSIAMDRGALPVARECLAETVRLLPEDMGASSRLDAFDDTMGDQLQYWTEDMLTPASNALESGIATESAGSLNVDDMGDVLAALEGVGASMPGDEGQDHGGRSSMLRDEIDVDIDDFFTRASEDRSEEIEIVAGTASMEDSFEELDQGSIESLPEEPGLRSDERGWTAMDEQPPIFVAGESIEDEDEEDEDTAQDPDLSDFSGFEQGAEEFLESDGGADHDDFLAVEIPDIIHIQPTVSPDDVDHDDLAAEEPLPAAGESLPLEIDIDIEMDMEEPVPSRPTSEVDLELPDAGIQRGTVESEDSEPSQEEDDDLALEPNQPLDKDRVSLDNGDELELEPRTELPQPQVELESELEPTPVPVPVTEGRTRRTSRTTEDEPSFDDDEPTSSDDDLIEEETGSSARLDDSDQGLDLILERSIEENDGDFEDMLADMANAIEDGFGASEISDGNDHIRANETDPDLDEIDLALGYYEVGLFKEALREFRAAFVAGIDPARALLYVGRCQRELDALDAANASLQLALEDTESGDPIYLDLIFEMGLTYEDQKQPGLARGMYEQILEIDDSYRGGEVAKRFMALADT